MDSGHLEAITLTDQQHLEDLERYADSTTEYLKYLNSRKDISDQYSRDRVRDYYLDSPLPIDNLMSVIEATRRVKGIEPMSLLALSVTGIEIIIKNLMIRPIVVGMLHDQSIADIVAGQLLKPSAIDRFIPLFQYVLNEHYYLGDSSVLDIK